MSSFSHASGTVFAFLLAATVRLGIDNDVYNVVVCALVLVAVAAFSGFAASSVHSHGFFCGGLSPLHFN